jgi:circadian clock protein KaiB
VKELKDSGNGEQKMILQLYVSGMTVKSMEAIENIRHLCDEYLEGAFQLEIIDLYKHPEAASEAQVVFSPSLIRLFPLPKKILIGNFSDQDKVVKGLGIVIKE